MVGRLMLLQWLEEVELSVLVGGEGGCEGLGIGALGFKQEGEGVARGADSSLGWPGRREVDGFLVPECGKKLAREKEAATAPHS